MPMIATTIINSINVKPLWIAFMCFPFPFLRGVRRSSRCDAIYNRALDDITPYVRQTLVPGTGIRDLCHPRISAQVKTRVFLGRGRAARASSEKRQLGRYPCPAARTLRREGLRQRHPARLAFYAR